MRALRLFDWARLSGRGGGGRDDRREGLSRGELCGQTSGSHSADILI